MIAHICVPGVMFFLWNFLHLNMEETPKHMYSSWETGIIPLCFFINFQKLTLSVDNVPCEENYVRLICLYFGTHFLDPNSHNEFILIYIQSSEQINFIECTEKILPLEHVKFNYMHISFNTLHQPISFFCFFQQEISRIAIRSIVHSIFARYQPRF